MAKATKASKAPSQAVVTGANGSSSHVMDKERIDFALDASWQIEGLFAKLIDIAAKLDETDYIDDASLLKALSLRGEALAGIVMDMVNDEHADMAEARALLQGKRFPGNQSEADAGTEAAHG